MENKVDKSKVYESSLDFFALGGSVIMKLSVKAAMDVCKNSIHHSKFILRIEGGIWHNPGFEARIDCIWDGLNKISKLSDAKENNNQAFDFIKEESLDECDTFIITTKAFILTD